MPSFPRQLSKYNQVVSFANSNNSLVLVNSIVFSDGTTISTSPYAIGLYANAAFTQANIVGAAVNTEVTLNHGINLTQNNYIFSSYDQANTALAYGQSGSSYANSGFIKANTAYILAQSGYDQANIATAQGQTSGSYANSAYNQANVGTTLAQNAYNSANTKLPLAGGEITGDLTVDGQANVYSRLAIGTGAYTILPNLIAQFTGTSDWYSQINQQNLRSEEHTSELQSH